MAMPDAGGSDGPRDKACSYNSNFHRVIFLQSKTVFLRLRFSSLCVLLVFRTGKTRTDRKVIYSPKGKPVSRIVNTEFGRHESKSPGAESQSWFQNAFRLFRIP